MIEVRYGKPEQIENAREVAFIKFKYQAVIVDEIHKAGSRDERKWNKETNEWELTKGCLKRLNSVFQDMQGIRDEDRAEDKKSREDYWEKAEIPREYKFKTEPFDYQRRYLEMALTRDKFLTGDQVGTGKSKQSLDLACIRKMYGQITHCLVVSGKNELKYNWRKQIEIHSFEKCKVIGSHLTKNGKNKEGSIKDRLKDLDNIKGSDIFFWITNIEAFRSEEFSNKIKELCDSNEIQMIIYDEATATKNPESLQSKGLAKVECQYKNVMSGTFIQNHQDELYFPLKWIGEENRTFEEFKKQYCVEIHIKKTMRGRWGGFYQMDLKKIVDDRNKKEMELRLKPLMIRRTKDEVQKDLPPILFEKQYVEMTPKQKKLYDEVREELLKQIEALGVIDAILKNKSNLEDELRLEKGNIGREQYLRNEISKLDRELEVKEKEISKVLDVSEKKVEQSASMHLDPQTLTMRLRQVTGCPQIINKNVKESGKLDLLEEMVRANVENNEKTIIFSSMTKVTNVIRERLKEFNPAYVTGEVLASNRQAEIDKLQEDESCKVIIGTECLKEGWTLTRANNVIMFDEFWEGDALEQCVGRISRVGQKRKMRITTLICTDSIDEKVNEMVSAKSDLSNQVLDGGKEVIKKSKIVSQADMIKFLLS